MTEERVTKYILKWLIDLEWKIICYDFPQSGTGRFLHPNGSLSKNAEAINPDIVAVKNHTCIFFENKDRFYYPDYEKINRLKISDDYSDAINYILQDYQISDYYYGIGIPVNAHSKKATEAEELVDFVIGVSEDGEIVKLYLKDAMDCFIS